MVRRMIEQAERSLAAGTTPPRPAGR